MREINLLPRELQYDGSDLKQIVVIALVFVILLGSCIYGSFLLHRQQALRQELAIIEQRLTRIHPRLEELKQLSNSIELNRKKISLLKDIKARRIEINPVLSGITGATPVEIQLTGLSVEYREQRMHLGGFASPGSPNLTPSVAFVAWENEGEKDNYPPGNGNAPIETVDDTHGPEELLPPRPNAVVLHGTTYQPEAIGIFIDRLAELPYFNKVNLLKMYTDGSAGGAHKFTIEAWLREVRQAERKQSRPE